jgi:hypothetical protein
MSLKIALVGTFLVFTAVLPPSAAGQKGKKPTTTPATGTFRCPGAECPVADPTAVPPVVTDAIRGDQIGLSYGPDDGAALDSQGEFSIQFVPNGRFLVVDFSNGQAPCLGCRRTFQSLELNADNLTVFHTNVIDPATSLEASDGLRSIPIGQTCRSRLKLAFDTWDAAGHNIKWAVRFNPRDYYPSDHISITRTSAGTWEAFATDAERAMLVSVAGRQRGYTNEGLYVVPFRVFISTP